MGIYRISVAVDDWNISGVIAIRPYWWWVDIASGNDFVLPDNKTFPGTVLIRMLPYVVARPLWVKNIPVLVS